MLKFQDQAVCSSSTSVPKLLPCLGFSELGMIRMPNFWKTKSQWSKIYLNLLS